MELTHSDTGLITSTLQVKFEGITTEIPYVVLQGNLPGPHLFVSAGMHGDEINGLSAAHEFIHSLENIHSKTLRGTISIFPVLNPTGFMHSMRNVAEDNCDLNRGFGYTKPVTFSQAIAAKITKYVKHCDFGIDLHDAGGETSLLPHVRIHKKTDDLKTFELGRVFGTTILIERSGDEHMFSVDMMRTYNIPVITVEIGGAQRVHKPFVKTAIQGIYNVMYANNMLDGDIVVPPEQFLLHDRYGLQTLHSGEVHIFKELGEYVHYNDVIGTMYYPQLGKQEELRSPMCGVVFAKWEKNQIPAHMVLFGVLETKKCHTTLRTTEQVTKLSDFRIQKYNFSNE